MKYEECKGKHEQSFIIIEHKQKILLNYKCTFNRKEMTVQAWRKKRMPSQREQYGDTVHLFIGTGRSPCKITLMPFTFINNSIVILQGLIRLFIFKSVSSWKLVISISFNFCQEVIVPGRREEYQVWATLLTAMTKDFAMTAVLPPYEDMVAS